MFTAALLQVLPFLCLTFLIFYSDEANLRFIHQGLLPPGFYSPAMLHRKLAAQFQVMWNSFPWEQGEKTQSA